MDLVNSMLVILIYSHFGRELQRINGNCLPSKPYEKSRSCCRLFVNLLDWLLFCFPD